jgi:glycosyltransferase involved in cell wall biosynthesis
VVVAARRAGGGARIKLLEGFAHGAPVVPTAAGVEGLDVEPGRHLLIADDADGLAEACRRLAAEPALAGRLRAEARRLVAARYDAGRVITAIRALVRDVPSTP